MSSFVIFKIMQLSIARLATSTILINMLERNILRNLSFLELVPRKHKAFLRYAQQYVVSSHLDEEKALLFYSLSSDTCYPLNFKKLISERWRWLYFLSHSIKFFNRRCIILVRLIKKNENHKLKSNLIIKAVLPVISEGINVDDYVHCTWLCTSILSEITGKTALLLN